MTRGLLIAAVCAFGFVAYVALCSGIGMALRRTSRRYAKWEDRPLPWEDDHRN